MGIYIAYDRFLYICVTNIFYEKIPAPFVADWFPNAQPAFF